MIYELRTHTLQPGKQPQFVSHTGEVGRAIRASDYWRLEGYWTSEFGLWYYRDLNERAFARSKAMSDPQSARVRKKGVPPLLMRMESTIRSPVSFSPHK